MPVTIRRFRKTERERWDALWLAYYKEGRVPAPQTRLQNTLWQALHTKDHPFKAYGITYGGQIVGLITYSPRFTPHALKPVLYISDLYIAPDFRRKKLAKRLLEHVIEKHSARHCRVEWKSRDDNPYALRLYKQYAKKSNWIIFERK